MFIKLCSCLLLAGSSASLVPLAAEEQAEEVKTLNQEQLNEAVGALAHATTSAQRHILTDRAMKTLLGAQVTVTVTVADVKPVIFKDKEQYALEAMIAEPPYKLQCYLSDPEQVLAINVGDTVTVQGTGQGLFTHKGRGAPTVALEDATLMPNEADAAKGTVDTAPVPPANVE